MLFSHFPSVELSGKLPKWENSIPTSQYPTVDTNRHFRFDSLAFWHIWHSGVTESCAAATIGKAMQCHGLIQFVLFQSFSIYFSLPPLFESSSTTQQGRKFSVRSAGDGSKANQCSAGYEGLNCGLCVFGYFPVTWRKDQLIETIERYWESMSNEVVRRFQKKCMSCKNFERLCKVQDFQHYCLIYMFIILEFGGILTLDFATLCDHIIQNYIYT